MNPKWLFWCPLFLTPAPKSETDFIIKWYSREDCYLRMNDFPDEPLWTLYFKGKKIDFDDKPDWWKIKYRNS
jgi:hypothetical protein